MLAWGYATVFLTVCCGPFGIFSMPLNCGLASSLGPPHRTPPLVPEMVLQASTVRKLARKGTAGETADPQRAAGDGRFYLHSSRTSLAVASLLNFANL